LEEVHHGGHREHREEDRVSHKKAQKTQKRKSEMHDVLIRQVTFDVLLL